MPLPDEIHTGAPRDEATFAARLAALSPEAQAHVYGLAREMLDLAAHAAQRAARYTGAVEPATAPVRPVPTGRTATPTDATTALLDVPGVAARIAVSERTVERIVAAGKLRPIWVQGVRRFHPATVDAYVREASKRPHRTTRPRAKRVGGEA